MSTSTKNKAGSDNEADRPKKKAKVQDSSDVEAEKSAPKAKLNGKAKETKPKGKVPDMFTKKPAAPTPAPAASTSKAKQASISEDEKSEASADSNAEEDSSENSEEDDEVASHQAEAVVAPKGKTASKKAVAVDLGDVPDWKDGAPVPYAALVHTLSKIESTTKRLEIASYLTQFLTKVMQTTPGDLLKVVYLCINRLCPDYEGLELGLGESTLLTAISESTGRTEKQIKADYKQEGDLGTVAQNSRNKQPVMFKPQPLTVPGVFKLLKDIAKIEGKTTKARKVGVIKKLIAACQGSEAKFIIRSLEGKLRIGLAEKSVLIAIAHAAVTVAVEESGKRLSKEAMTKKLENATDVVKSVFSEMPSYDDMIPALLEVGIEGLKEKCKLTAGVPLKPMLAKPTKAISEVLDRFEGKKFTCEYKYDGERAQVHYLPDKSLRVFSRNSEDMSKKYPDLVEQLPKCIKADITQSFVLDCEAVAWDIEEKRMLPFQDLSRRKRKDVRAEDVTVRVCLFAFDLLFLNGESLLHKDLSTRRDLLRKHFQPVEGEFAFATWSDAENTEEISLFLDASIKDGCEGLMVKMLEGEAAYYEPSRRSMNWLKVKKDYLAGTGDSFDLVVIGGYQGRGKRSQWYGAYLLACYDPEGEQYQAICKIGTGFSDEQLAKFHSELKPLEIGQKKSYYDVGDAKPEVFFEPQYVWEILAADLSLSPVYSAAKGLVAGGRGISLRFPRLIRVRDDKKSEDATDSEQVMEAYNKQATVVAGKKGKGKKGGGADDDFW